MTVVIVSHALQRPGHCVALYSIAASFERKELRQKIELAMLSTMSVFVGQSLRKLDETLNPLSESVRAVARAQPRPSKAKLDIKDYVSKRGDDDLHGNVDRILKGCWTVSGGFSSQVPQRAVSQSKRASRPA